MVFKDALLLPWFPFVSDSRPDRSSDLVPGFNDVVPLELLLLRFVLSPLISCRNSNKSKGS